MHERPAVVDADDDGTPVGEVRDAHVSADGERTRRRGERVLIESFAAGSSTPLELCAIPRRHADLNRSRRRRFVSKERATWRQQAHRSKGGQACDETSVDVSSRHHPQRAPTGGWRSALSAGRWRSLNRRGAGVNGLQTPTPPAAPFRTHRRGPLTTRVPPEVEVDRIPEVTGEIERLGAGLCRCDTSDHAPHGLFRMDPDEGSGGRLPNGATCQPPFPVRSRFQAQRFHGLAGSSSRLGRAGHSALSLPGTRTPVQ